MERSLQVAWAAGFFDGEGTIAFAVMASTHSFNLFVSQKIQEPLEVFQELWRGVITPNRRDDMWVWRAPAETRLSCMTEMLPFLVVKRKQMELALEWYSLSNEATGRKPGTRYSPTVIQQRAALVEQIRTLKRPWKAS